jgi:DNA invertase Pin-like site-specific DNA recombinase
MAKTWGYARVSTDDQELRSQIDALNRHGVDGIFEEKQSGKNNDRDVLNWMLNEVYLREGDTVVVHKLDRLGRSLTGLIDIVKTIEDRGAHLISITDHIDTKTANGKFFFHVIAAMAQWERDMISERTRAGMAAAKAAGATFGRKRVIADNEKRLRHIRSFGDAVFDMKDQELLDALNGISGVPDIGSLETARRWRREGYPGLKKGAR